MLGHLIPFGSPERNFAFLSLVPMVMNLLARFHVSTCNISRSMVGVRKFKSYVISPFPDPFRRSFAFLSLVPLLMNLHAKFDVFS